MCLHKQFFTKVRTASFSFSIGTNRCFCWMSAEIVGSFLALYWKDLTFNAVRYSLIKMFILGEVLGSECSWGNNWVTFLILCSLWSVDIVERNGWWYRLLLKNVFLLNTEVNLCKCAYNVLPLYNNNACETYTFWGKCTLFIVIFRLFDRLMGYDTKG